MERVPLNDDITLWVNEALIELRHGYWRVPIGPSREPDYLPPYYEALADLEEELGKPLGLRISVAPGDPLTK